MLNVAICDDDILCVQTVKKIVEKYLIHLKMDYQIFTFKSGDELLRNAARFDLAFLDIEMPGTNGMEVHKKLKERYAATICVFITSYQHYMDDAIMLQPYGFISKPINEKRLSDLLVKLINAYMEKNKFIYVKTEDGFQKIKTNDIIYASIEGRKVHIHTVDGDIQVNEDFSHYKQELSEPRFCQTHQSFIVNMSFIKSINKNSVVLSCKNPATNETKEIIIHISARRYASVKRAYLGYVGGGKK